MTTNASWSPTETKSLQTQNAEREDECYVCNRYGAVLRVRVLLDRREVLVNSLPGPHSSHLDTSWTKGAWMHPSLLPLLRSSPHPPPPSIFPGLYGCSATSRTQLIKWRGKKAPPRLLMHFLPFPSFCAATFQKGKHTYSCRCMFFIFVAETNSQNEDSWHSHWHWHWHCQTLFKES